MKTKGKLMLITISNIFMLNVAQILNIFKLNYLVELIIKQVNVNMKYVKEWI